MQIGSIFEYANKNPVFGVLKSDSIFYAPLLGFFVFTGIPTSVCYSTGSLVEFSSCFLSLENISITSRIYHIPYVCRIFPGNEVFKVKFTDHINYVCPLSSGLSVVQIC